MKMAVDNFGVVFGERQLGRQIGSGTDGRVYFLKPKDNEKKSVVKIIKLSHSKILETKDKNNPAIFAYTDGEYCSAFIKNITDNIELLRSYDGGHFFADCYEWETRPSSDGDADILMIRMEALTPLSDFLGEYSFTQEEVLRLAACLCGSLDKCRDFGFIYPNLKPENVMFDSIGRCKLGDLGTFCCLPPAKNSIAFRRTQQYMAPEFYKSDEINETCDTYSLGLVMYALLNKGRIPFLPSYPAEITMNDLAKSLNRRVNGEDIPAPKMADSDVSSLVLKAISFDPKNRYRTPRHMLSDIRKLLNGEEIVFDEEENEPEVQEYAESLSGQTDSEALVEPREEVYNLYDAYVREDEAQTDEAEDVSVYNSSDNSGAKRKIVSIKENEFFMNLNKHQKTVLALLIAALAVLIITVIVLAIKYSTGANGESTALSVFISTDSILQRFSTL